MIDLYDENCVIFEPDPSLHFEKGFLSNDIHKIKEMVNNTNADLRRTVYVKSDNRCNLRFVDSTDNVYALFYMDKKWDYKVALLNNERVERHIGTETYHNNEWVAVSSIKEICNCKTALRIIK
jgi:hypothetical protein